MNPGQSLYEQNTEAEPVPEGVRGKGGDSGRICRIRTGVGQDKGVRHLRLRYRFKQVYSGRPLRPAFFNRKAFNCFNGLCISLSGTFSDTGCR
ncbi:hypothetical protein DENIS_3304 [Desulfonema ishimotonii]|uniref:Uncharacterized protein n=1 Tax=Desulfonema ishimotonii TaxID=45657 RepID=A0A401FZE4_9BACT|nr:hypothetical protein DENIS_3304 [Desulfonema ishimotonii]